jgi:hypothetical protein
VSSNSRKDIEALAIEAESQGWTIVRTVKNHFQFIPPDKTKPIVLVESTASNPKRAMANTLARMRASGFVRKTS